MSMSKKANWFSDTSEPHWSYMGNGEYRLLISYLLDVGLAIFFSVLFFFSALGGIWGGSEQWGWTSLLSGILAIILWFVVWARRD